MWTTAELTRTDRKAVLGMFNPTENNNTMSYRNVASCLPERIRCQNFDVCHPRCVCVCVCEPNTYLITYLLHGAESFLSS